jgi:hypothetical protein
MEEDIKETFEEWEERMDAWLASLPEGHPVHLMDPIGQCVAFSKWDEERKTNAG